jgi:hypothetical protein
MSDETSSDSTEQTTDAQQPDGQGTVDIDPTPRVGKGGGTDSFHHKVNQLEEG